MTRRLIVNGDDFGFTHDVNSGIVEAHRGGVLTATTLMANGAAFQDAVRLARENPSLDVGCHLVLVGGRSLLPEGRPLPATLGQLIRAIALRRIRIYEELEAQVRAITDAGVKPTHLDTHKHTHALPPVLAVVVRLAREFGIPWVRRPLLFPLCAHGCRTTDHFKGYRLTGRFNAADLVALIHALPQGTTEFMCHPGHCGPELRAARTRLKDSRAAELKALLAPETRAASERAGISLVSFRDL